MRFWRTLAGAFGAGLILLAASAGPSLAQTAGDTGLLPPAARHDSNQIPEKFKGSGSSAEPLSRQLDRSGGVLHPPTNVDPGMTQTPPKIGGRSTPVIPPPGSGGDSQVNPK